MDELDRAQLQYDSEMLAALPRLEHAQVLLRVTEAKMNEIRKQLEHHPKRDPHDITQGVDYKLGQINALRWVIERPKEAQAWLENNQRRA